MRLPGIDRHLKKGAGFPEEVSHGETSTSGRPHHSASYSSKRKPSSGGIMAHCPHCGGPLTLIAAIEEPAVIVKILTQLGFPTKIPSKYGVRHEWEIRVRHEY